MDTRSPARPDTVAAVDSMGSRYLGIEGIHVHLDGTSAVEQHWMADLRRDVFSVSKTFTSVAVGIAQDEGLLDVDDPVLGHLGHLTPTPPPGLASVTIRDLLTMTSGIVYRWDDPDADHPGDPAAEILAAPLGAAPGDTFAYRGANTYLLSRIIRACSGQDLCSFLVPRLFDPLGIRNPQWLRCPLGHLLGAVGLLLRTDTVDTGGHLANGATAPHPDNARYGRGVWSCDRDGAWRMDGIYGRSPSCCPDSGRA